MPEILTESFCERCGTRYTFESTAPRKTRRLGQFKTLSKGLKNYVLSDDLAMDEAMAAARSDEEREATTQQLDAFHATFNFCMNCRQYTCGNCWNHAEGRCLTCAPHLGQEILPAPFPSEVPFDQVQLAADAWPTADLPAAELTSLETILAEHRANGGGNGAGAPVADTEPASGAAPDSEEIEDVDVGARLSFLMPKRSEDGPAAATPPAPDAAPTAEPAAAQAFEGDAAETLPSDSVAERASTLADHTSVILGRFRPGQNIDAELEAYEATLTETAPETEPMVAEVALEPPAAAFAAEPIERAAADAEAISARGPAAEAVASEPELAEAPVVEAVAQEPEPVAATAEAPVAQPQPVAEPEPEPVAATAEAPVAQPQPVAEPEPIAAAAETPAEPVAAEPEAPRVDRVEQPTWRIFAPDQPMPGPEPAVPPVVPIAPPPAQPAQATAEPQWPAQPDWQESPSMALLANRSRASSDALWAASAQEVLAPPSTGPIAPVAGVQPCSNCGLSLSATARFCRRCGSRQG